MLCINFHTKPHCSEAKVLGTRKPVVALMWKRQAYYEFILVLGFLLGLLRLLNNTVLKKFFNPFKFSVSYVESREMSVVFTVGHL